ncbi:ketopantoate reductase family protein [Peribacillus sp. SCS-37]|uniref:ketopantoate reductase family protein n=1 Tax=Paraperibacillus esterisolvens TaxID=3115296 RepID=UPI00390652B5
MKVGVVGAGAVGGYFGSLLKQGGNNVVFLARGKHLEAMKGNGLTVEAESGTFNVKGNFTDQYEELTDSDLLLFCVKSTDTYETALRIKPYLKDGALILTLQNGVDNEDILSTVFEKERIFSAASYIQVFIKEPGIIKQIGNPPRLVMGGIEESQETDLKKISTFLNLSGIETFTTRNITETKWKKLLWNVTFNPITALLEISVGEILDSPDLKRSAVQICMESIKVAKSMGVALDNSACDEILAQGAIARNHQTSMLQDKLRGKKMEVESICGYIVKKGREYNVPTPVLETIYHLLKFQDSIIQSKGGDMLA